MCLTHCVMITQITHQASNLSWLWVRKKTKNNKMYTHEEKINFRCVAVERERERERVDSRESEAAMHSDLLSTISPLFPNVYRALLCLWAALRMWWKLRGDSLSFWSKMSIFWFLCHNILYFVHYHFAKSIMKKFHS